MAPTGRAVDLLSNRLDQFGRVRPGVRPPLCPCLRERAAMGSPNRLPAANSQSWVWPRGDIQTSTSVARWVRQELPPLIQVGAVVHHHQSRGSAFRVKSAHHPQDPAGPDQVRYGPDRPVVVEEFWWWDDPGQTRVEPRQPLNATTPPRCGSPISIKSVPGPGSSMPDPIAAVAQRCFMESQAEQGRHPSEGIGGIPGQSTTG